MRNGGVHHTRSLLQAFDERANTFVLFERSAGARALSQRSRLLRECGLQLREHLCAVFQLLLRAVAALIAALQIPGRKQDLALPFGDRALLVAHAAAIAVAALRLQEAALERLHRDHEQIGLHCRLAILRDCVVRNQVARDQRLRLLLRLCSAQLFQVEQRLTFAGLRTATDRHRLPFAAVHRVAQRHVTQPEVILGADAHRYFFDAGGAPVAAGLADLDGRLLVGNHFDRVLVAQRHELVRDARTDLISPRLGDRDCASAGASVLRKLASAAVDDQRWCFERRVGDNLDPDVRAFDRPDVARRFVGRRGEPGPLRIFVRQLHTLDARQIDDGDVVLAAARAFCVDVVLQRTADGVEPEFEPRVALGCRLHRRAFPVLPIGEAHEHGHFFGMKAIDRRANRQVAVATNRRVARRHRHAAHGNCVTRQLHSKQQMATAEAPVRRTCDEQRHEHTECGDGDQHPGRDATRGNDRIGRRALRDRDCVGGEQTQQRRGEPLRLTTLAIEISVDAAILVRQPLLENV